MSSCQVMKIVQNCLRNLTHRKNCTEKHRKKLRFCFMKGRFGDLNGRPRDFLISGIYTHSEVVYDNVSQC